MRAARLATWGSAPVVQDVPDPQPAPGEALVQVAASTISHIDMTVAGGDFALRPPLPYVVGTAGAGVVLRSGRLATGTPVRIGGAGVGLTRDGTCAQLAAVPDEALHELAPGTDLKLASTFFSPCVTAHAALHAVGSLSAGERVAVTGASGAIGSVALQLATQADAGLVVAVTRDPARLRVLPAEAIVATDANSLAAAVPDGVDLLVDTVGGPALPDLITGCMRPGGRAVLVGYTAGENVVIPLPALMAADVRLLPMNMIRLGSELGHVGQELLLALQRGELQLPLTVFALDQIAEAIGRLRAGTAAGRIVLVPDDTG